MALVLGVPKGKSIYINDIPLTVDTIYSEKRIKVKVEDGYMIKFYELTDSQRVEVLPEVFCSIGNRSELKVAKIAIEAPKHIKLLRSKIYNENKNHRVGN